MNESFPLALFSGTGMTFVFVTVVIIELLSLGFLWFASYEFRKMMGRHETLLSSMNNGGEHAYLERNAHAIFWIYITLTLAATVVTMLLFAFQPHLL